MMRPFSKYPLLMLAFILLAMRPAAVAQLDATLYHMSTIPQVKYTNPASGSDYKWYIGLPGISSIYANVHHNGFVVADLLKKRADDSVYFDMDNVIEQLGDRNLFGFNLQVDLLAFGWSRGDNRFFFNITEKATARIRYPKDLMVLLWEGNGGFVDKTLDFSGSALRFSEYREYAFGMSRAFSDELTIGAKAKLLSGYVNASTTVSKLELYTAPNTFELTGSSDVEINISMPPDDGAEFVDHFIALKNVGLGIDLGATYKLSDEISVSASIIDLGYINWKRNPTNFSNDLDGATFRGNAINTFIDSTSNQPFGEIADSLLITFNNLNETNNSYKDGLVPRVYLGGSYNLNEVNKIGLLFHGEYFKSAFYPSLTLSYNYKLPKWIGFSASYSIMNGTFSNLGMGLSLNLGPFQLYCVSDNVGALFNLADINGAIIPYKAKTMHLRTGIGLTFSQNEKDKDKDGIKDKEDECPDIKGPKELNGCPDRDGDGIIDKHDECPDDPGLPMNKGCPDRDNDNVIDKNDDCPDIPGEPENRGCPVRLHLLDDVGDEVLSAELNDDGFFAFENLPDKDKYLFRLDAADVGMIQEVQVLRTLDGKETVLTALKNDDGMFEYERKVAKTQQLYLIDMKGDTLMMAKLDENGFFVFEPLPANRSHIFLMDGDPNDLLDDLLIMLIDKDGNKKIIRATQDGTNKFRYEYIPPKEHDLDLLEDEEIPVILMEEEAEIVNTAFDNLEFNSGSAVISFGSFAALNSLSDLLKKKPKWRIKLSGHTDNVGAASANLLLSKKRAESVERALGNRGVDASRVIVRYYGEEVPIATNKTTEGQQANRRVEMLIIQPEDYAGKIPEDGVAFPGEEGVWFKIQIAASGKPIPLDKEHFKGVENVSEYSNRGMFKYTVGKEATFEQANKVMLPALKARGFTGAFIVAFKDGRRIPVSEAIEFLEGK